MLAKNNNDIITAKTVILRVTIIIASVEAFIMLLLGNISHGLIWYLEAMLDVGILVLIASPLIYLLVVKPNIVARDNALAEITRMALHDPLTQLPNRRLLIESLERSISKHVRHKIYGALLFLDLDSFKSINDTKGHAVGDAILIEVAIRIKSQVRSSDNVGRLGGDEFLIHLDHISSDEETAIENAEHKANLIRQEIFKPFTYKGTTFTIECSIGIRMLGPDSQTAKLIISEADCAMYKAKQHESASVLVHEISDESI